MARELTAQETQILSRIRERMADATQELASAVRTRRQLEAQLREVQHQMASPDGIISSQQFFDDVSRLRREIQIAIAHEQEADTTRRRLSAEEMQALGSTARQSRRGDLAENIQGTAMLADAGVGHLLALGEALSRTHQTIARSYNQVHNARSRELSAVNIKAAQRVKPPSTTRYSLFIGLSLFVDIVISPIVTAAWATIILGILATVVLAIVMAVLGRIMLGSNGKKATQHRKELEENTKELERDIQVVQQEYRSFLLWLNTVGKRFPQIAARASTSAARIGRVVGKYKMVRYAGKAVNWLKKGWVKQTSEAIPIWNILPWWTIGAVATYLSHRGDYKEAQSLLASYNEGKISALNMKDTIHETQMAFVQSVFSDVKRNAAITARNSAPEPRPAI